MRSPRTPILCSKMELAARDDVEAVSPSCKVLEDRQIAVRFHGETKRVWNPPSPRCNSPMRIIDSGAAIQIGRRADTLQPHPAKARPRTQQPLRGSIFPELFHKKCGVNAAGSTNESFLKESQPARSSHLQHHQRAVIRQRRALRKPIHLAQDLVCELRSRSVRAVVR